MEGKVVYAPDVVGVGRLFMIALEAPPEAPDVRVALPDAVEMFDHTRPPVKDVVRRFYFRALRQAERAEIRFALPDGEAVASVQVWSFEDLRRFRTLNGVQLPRRWPLGRPLPELKQRQTITTPAEIAALQGDPGIGTRWLERSDDDIWEMQPDTTIPRNHWVNLPAGCPAHGPEVYRIRAYYPWEKDLSFPYKWKMRCPIGGEEYPSNDFAHGDMTGGECPDDGIGGGYRKGDQQYCFIAELAQAYSLVMRQVAPESAQAYLADGGARAARLFPKDHSYGLGETWCGALFGALEEAGVPVLVDLDQTDWREIDGVLAAHPRLNLILLQAGYRSDRWLYPLVERYPGLRVESGSYSPYRGFEALTRRFGPDRIVFGTGLPIWDAGSAIATVQYAEIDEESRLQIASETLRGLLWNGA